MGYYAGNYINTSAQNCVSIGTYSGQASNDFNVYNQSVCIGYASMISGSNQIVLGTATETIYVPGNIILNGTNILTTVSGQINNSLTTFKTLANTWSGINTFKSN